jgi:hypothetical protein
MNLPGIRVRQQPRRFERQTSGLYAPREYQQAPVTPDPATYYVSHPTQPMREQIAFPVSLPESSQPGRSEDAGRPPEDAQEGTGRQNEAPDLRDRITLKKFLNEAGRKYASGASIDSILRDAGLQTGGRNNQNLKMLLEAQQQEGQE